MKKALIAALCLLALPACAAGKPSDRSASTPDCHQTAMSQTDMDICAGDDAKKARAELDKELKHIRTLIGNNHAKQEMLTISQNTWETYMHAQVDFLYSDHDGSVTPMCDSMMVEGLIYDRIKQLKNWTGRDNTEGDVCATLLGPLQR